MIEPGQTIGDFIHETDLFTTIACFGGAFDYVLSDRVIDRVDQTALFVEDNVHSRRVCVPVYSDRKCPPQNAGAHKAALFAGRRSL